MTASVSSVGVSPSTHHFIWSVDVSSYIKCFPPTFKVRDVMLWGLLYGGSLATQDIRAFFSRRVHIVHRIEAAFSILLNLKRGANGVAFSFKSLNYVKLIGREAVKWIPIFTVIGAGVEGVLLGYTAFSTYRCAKFLYTFSRFSKIFSLTDNTDVQLDALNRVTAIMQGERFRVLRKEMQLSEESGKSLRERIDKLRELLLSKESGGSEERLQAQNSLVESFGILKQRAKLELGIKCVRVVNSIICIAGQLLSVTPLSLVGNIVASSTTCVSGVLNTVQVVFINQNPFDARSKSWSGLVLDKVCKVARESCLFKKHNNR